MPIKIDGVKFRVHKTGDIYYSSKFENLYNRLFENKYKFANNKISPKILHKIKFSEDGVTAKEAYYAYTATGKFLTTREFDLFIEILKSESGLNKENKN